MKLLSTLLVLLVAAEHFYIAWLEMTQIPSEKAAEMFKLPYEFMEQKRVQTLFSNQGLFAIRQIRPSFLLRKQCLSLRELFQSLWERVGVRAAKN